mgnify:CR=1 FL=1
MLLKGQVINYGKCKKIINDLKDTLKADKKLMALAAPQIGYEERIFCVKFADGSIKAYINPIITKVKELEKKGIGRPSTYASIITKIQDYVLNIESSPSLPEKEYMVRRPNRILLGYQEVDGHVKSDIEFKYPVSAIIDQMIDVLDGTLFFNYDCFGVEIDDKYYKASQEDKDELHKYYEEVYYPAKLKELQAIAAEDKDITKFQEYVGLLTRIAKGESGYANIDDNGAVTELTDTKAKVETTEETA